MRIAHVACVFPPYFGGIGNSAYMLARLAAKRGYEITVFTPKYKTGGAIKAEQIKIERLAPALACGNGAFLCQLFSRLEAFDIAHLHYPFFGTGEVVWAAKLFKKNFKLVIHYHMDASGLSLLARILSLPEKFTRISLLNFADIIICSSVDYIKHSRLDQYYKKHSGKFKELPFGVDSDIFKPKEKKDSGKKKLLFVGGLDRAHYFKGVEILLKAAARLKANKNWELTIVGDGELKPNYIKLADKLKIGGNVNFVGGVDNNTLISIYQSADLFILPSINKNEAFGIVLLEAMSSAVPVIASRLPGVRTVFNDGIEGRQVKPGDVYELAGAIDELLADSEKMKSLGQAGRKLVKEKYTWDRIGERLDQIYKNVYK